METNYFAYIRCSTIQQSYNRQYKQLLDFCHKENIKLNPANIYSEKRTGKNQDRPKFKELVSLLLKKEQAGEHCCLVLIELSRMGRSYQLTKDTWNELTSAGVDIVVTSFPLLDTRNKDNGAVSLMLTDIVFAVLNYLTEQELNEKPVLILDDVFSELDNKRQKLLYKLMENTQVIVTGTAVKFKPEGEYMVKKIKNANIKN